MRKPTYKEKLEQDRSAMIASGLVSERYAEIAAIEFRMTYYRRGQDQVLMTRTLSFRPEDYAGFHIKCLHDGCANGGYDLGSVVASMVKGRKRSASGKIFCHGTNNTIGHASMVYTVSIQYA